MELGSRMAAHGACKVCARLRFRIRSVSQAPAADQKSAQPETRMKLEIRSPRKRKLRPDQLSIAGPQ